MACTSSKWNWGQHEHFEIEPARRALHERNFAKSEAENPRFWERLGGAPSLEGKRVLDLGCGLGGLCLDVVRRGARTVLGVDLEPELVGFARRNLTENHPDLADRVRFEVQDVLAYSGEPFDCITSKDAFEHIHDLPGVLDALWRCLKPGGRLYVALGPLYESPFGDHGRLRAGFPWGHLLLPERVLIERLKRRFDVEVARVEELGLNKYRLDDFRRVLERPGFERVLYRENASHSSAMRVFSALKRVPWLERFVTFNIYCVLERKG